METGAETVFGLNALRGKTIETKEFIYENGRVGENTIATGEWDSSNSEFLIRYTVDKGYKIHGWTLGNELGGHTLFIGVSAKDYTEDTKKLHELLEGIYKKYNSKPLIIAPGAIFDDTWYKEYIDQTPELHAATHHMYNLGAGDSDKLAHTILTASFFDEQTRNMFRDLQNILKETGGKTVAWIGESGGAFNSGKDGISNTFINGFWYLNMLGFAAIHDTKTYCRQTLTGGNYGLLGTDTLIPNPDYYSALLWHRLMGKKVLKTKFIGTKNVYAYAHCAKESTGITILLLNQDGKSSAKASFNSAIYGRTREEYHLTPSDENIQSRNVMLNGKLLYVGPSGVIPSLEPDKKETSKEPILEVAPHSIVFVHLPQANLPACKVRAVPLHQ